MVYTASLSSARSETPGACGWAYGNLWSSDSYGLTKRAVCERLAEGSVAWSRALSATIATCRRMTREKPRNNFMVAKSFAEEIGEYASMKTCNEISQLFEITQLVYSHVP